VLFTYIGQSLGSGEKRSYTASALGRLVDTIHKIHNLKILHRDLRSSNILLNAVGELVVIDFGVSVEVSGQDDRFQSHFVGTLMYTPQEHLRQLRSNTLLTYNRSTDLQSLVKTWVCLILSFEAKFGLQISCGNCQNDPNCLRDVAEWWDTCFQTFVWAKEAQKAALTLDYAQLKKVFSITLFF
jgi:serine/threonine protein kinase